MIQIFKDGIEIDVVKDTLTIQRENTFLDNDFKIQTNSFPFLIIENDNARRVLGSRHETSINRDVFQQVTVITPEGSFEGELQILSYPKNYRKCNLRFFSPIYNLKDRKISEFLPDNITTITGPLQPPYGYEEKRESLIEPEFMDSWVEYGVGVISKGFPNTLFNLPMIHYPDKFGTDLNEDDNWIMYQGNINGVWFWDGVRYMHDCGYMVMDGVHFKQDTVNAPKVYLLAPLKQAVESVGYTLDGTFYNSQFVRRILMDSEKDNLTEINLKEYVMDVDYYSEPWEYVLTLIRAKVLEVTLTAGRKYRVEIELKRIKESSNVMNCSIKGDVPNTVSVFENLPYDDLQTASADFIVSVPGTEGTILIEFVEATTSNNEPLQVNFIKIYEVADQPGFITHPIINLQRFVPDWSFIDYLNELKKLFNLKITPNDHEKVLKIDFFHDSMIEKKGVPIESLLLDDFESMPNNSLLLKYDNEIDKNVYVTKDAIIYGNTLPAEHTKEVLTKFKYLPVTNSGLTLNEEIEDKGGVGLMIYDHTSIYSSIPIPSYDGYTLDLQNVFKEHHELSFRNYLTSGIFKTKGFSNHKMIKDIYTDDFVIIDNKRYYVNDMKYKESPSGLYETEFELILMVY